MLQSGIPVPTSWEHRNDAKPGKLNRDDWASARAKGTAGWVEAYELDAQGKAWANVEIPDAEDGRKAETVRFCSPEIDCFTDGDGRDWGEVITHVALTPRPVQHNQPPIARLSYLGPIRLAIDPTEGTDMADDADDDKKKAPPPPKKKGEGKDDAPLPDAGGMLKKALEALEKLGLVLGDGVTPENFLERLYVAGLTKSAADGDLSDLDDEPGDELPPDVSTSSQQPPLALSQTEQKLRAKVLKDESSALRGRIDRALRRGQITPDYHRKLTAEHAALTAGKGKVRLSLDADGEVLTVGLHHKLEAIEALPRNAAFSTRDGATAGKTRLSHGGVRVVDPPEAPVDADDGDFMAQYDAMMGPKKSD